MATQTLTISDYDMNSIYYNRSSTTGTINYNTSQSAIQVGSGTAPIASITSYLYTIGYYQGYTVKKIVVNARKNQTGNAIGYLTLWGQEMSFNWTVTSRTTYYDVEITPSSLTATSANTIKLECKDATPKGAMYIKSITITFETPDPLSVSLSESNIEVGVGNTYHVTLTVSGGVQPYSVRLYTQPSYSTVSITQVTTGEYDIAIVGESIGHDSVLLQVSDVSSLTRTVSIDITVSGDIPHYVFKELVQASTPIISDNNISLYKFDEI